jgi:predicted Fe-Mo cluster-binding NifX family protein
MKIAISATGRDLDDEVEPRFGRCSYFIIIDPETMDFEVIDNPAAMAGGGAGISAAQAIADKGVQVLLTGNCGPNAFQVLSAAGIQLITGVSGNISDVIKRYRSGKYHVSTRANVPDHFGMGAMPEANAGFGMSRGGGKGCGMGRGRGKGMGGGKGMSMGRSEIASAVESPIQYQSPEQELQALKSQSHTLTQQLSDIQRRIRELENK